MKKLQSGQTLDEFVSDQIATWIQGSAYGDHDIYLAMSFPKRARNLNEEEREWVYGVFARYEEEKHGRLDYADLLIQAERVAGRSAAQHCWGAVLVDEFQDLNYCGLTLVKHLAGHSQHKLFFVGDHRQRIFRSLPSFKEVNLRIEGRSRVLTENYRNSPEIYAAAQSVLAGNGDDPDEVDAAVTATDVMGAPGTRPFLYSFAAMEEENQWICMSIDRLVMERGRAPGEIAIVVNQRRRMESLQRLLQRPVCWLEEENGGSPAYFSEDKIKLTTMHTSKGLEFPIVFLVGMSAETFWWVRANEESEETAKSLLYVAMTRARSQLAITFSGVPARVLAAADLACFQTNARASAMIASERARSAVS